MIYVILYGITNMALIIVCLDIHFLERHNLRNCAESISLVIVMCDVYPFEEELYY